MPRSKKSNSFEDVVNIVSVLRGDKGCPWDRKQTHDSIVFKLVEESYEMVDAVRRKDYPMMKDELGDLLLNIVFHAQMAEEKGMFKITDVMEHLCEKMQRRHPHVFADKKVRDMDELKKQWEDIKGKEKGSKSRERDLDERFPVTFPALLRLYKFVQFLTRTGDFDTIPEPNSLEDDLLKLVNDIHNAKKLGKRQKENAIADLLFLAVRLAYNYKVDPEVLLQEKTDSLIEYKASSQFED